MTVAPVVVSPSWLALREEADARARSADLVEELRPRLPPADRVVVHDLGCGTGSMGRWLAPRLPGPQHWILSDRDTALLAIAATRTPAAGADGAPVTVETRQRDITRLDPAGLAGASLITASALLDMLTADELDRFVAACASAGCPVLVTLSVIGGVDLRPADPLDERVSSAFNAHQRRVVGGRPLLGPDAVGAAVDAFGRLGFEVVVRPSPWRLGAGQVALTTELTAQLTTELTTEWLAGWVGAAREQEPGLVAATATYEPRRVAEANDGRLSVTVEHQDLLAWPR